MISFRRLARTIVPGTLILLSLYSANAQDGRTIFQTNCASCHKLDGTLTGPGLRGVEDRWNGDRSKIHQWVHNPGAYQAKDPYAAGLVKQYPVLMTAFPQLSDKEIDAVLDYIKNAPLPGTPAGGDQNAAAAKESGDNTLLFGVLTLILAVVALTLLQVNANLKKLADEREGHASVEPVPFWRNKSYIAILTVVLFVIGGYLTSQGAMALGRTKDYQPVQPIFYSHKVHAGINQISCQYCHIGVYQGKQATIPSVNICMNCHMAITEYSKGPKLFTEEGTEVNANAEIQKLYKAAGYEPGKPWDASKAQPIEWKRLHNLPDHVYFNHSQHVKAGQVACQTCHGEIQKMDEVKQFTDLSMGWCINCHRETKVQFKDNGFYSIYEKYHDDLKNGRIDSAKGITVEKIGGTECQKCHY
jgi:cytochrome c